MNFDSDWRAAKGNDLLQVIDTDQRQLQMHLFGIGAEFNGAFVTLAGVEHTIDAVTAGSAHDGADVFRAFRVVQADARIAGAFADSLVSGDGLHGKIRVRLGAIIG